jgi:antitoxin (DNA-binding transcriptional repressor) of toxin-antitoxin stability system
MIVYGLSEAQSDLDTLIDRALAGEEVLIAVKGEVVAELGGMLAQSEPVGSIEQAED